MKGLYSNIGNKVCIVAKVCGFIGVASFVIGLICLTIWFFAYEDALLVFGPILMLWGIVSLISSWPLYAFGQITNDIHAMRGNT